MKLPYALSKTSAFLNRDLHGMFRKILRKSNGRIPRLKAGVRERCGELGRCKKSLPEGRRPKTPDWGREVEMRGLTVSEAA